MAGNIYIAIDLKSFYASVECRERGLDPMTTNLVVADASRTEKTICLAVSPSLKTFGIPGRPRLFEVVQKVREENSRRRDSLGRPLRGRSWNYDELMNDGSLAVDYVIAPPRMAHYLEYSTRIYDVYLKYISPEDIHVYSIDEIFIYATHYLSSYGMTAQQLAMVMMKEVLRTTGITATCGIGTNLYLAKIAMDIVAKHAAPDENGVRIAELDEMSYRKLLWNHEPLNDFWRVGRGISEKLAKYGIFTMGDIARCSVGQPNDFFNEDLLYKLFGVNAELLIDHAWGYEPCTMKDIKEYKPSASSIGSGQVLQEYYTFDRARLVVREMTDMIALDLVDKGLVTDQLVLQVGYDIENLTDPDRRSKYSGEITVDRYGREIPKHAHGTVNLGRYSNSSFFIVERMMELFDRIVDENLLVRRINMSANHVIDEMTARKEQSCRQLDLFEDTTVEVQKENSTLMEKEKALAHATLDIKKKFGKNAILKGMNLEEGATARMRTGQIGGHKA